MKVLIAVDIEGISGIANSREYEHFSYGNEWITEDTNAAINGALSGGADLITVSDTHGKHNDNILIDRLHPKARVIRGGKNTPLYFLEGLTRDTDLVMLIGWHDKIGGQGILSHTFVAREISSMKINGLEVGEVEIASALAGEFGVPIGLVTGDDITCEKAKSWLGDVETACVKRAIDRYVADCLPLVEARELIRQQAERAVIRGLSKDFKPFHFTAPYTLEWKCADHNIAKLLGRVPGAELMDNNVVRYTSDNFINLFNMLFTWRWMLKAASVPN